MVNIILKKLRYFQMITKIVHNTFSLNTLNKYTENKYYNNSETYCKKKITYKFCLYRFLIKNIYLSIHLYIHT